MLSAGDAAPAFTSQSHTSATIRLDDYRGKIVLLWFYPRAATPG